MKRPRAPLFLERDTYRRRRLMDGARVLPVLGFVLILLPVLWTQGGQMGTAGEAVYLFGLWVLLILAAALMARPLRAALRRDEPPALPDPAEPRDEDLGA
jgi:peptidoglycan/LPS O-acetylase OafA/YrhL